MRSRPVSEVKFFETYYFANIIHNILSDQFEYIQTLHDFYVDDEWAYYAKPFQKRSVFHYFIEYIIDTIFYEDLEEFDVNKVRENRKKIPYVRHFNTLKLSVNDALIKYHIEHTKFSEYLSEIDKSYEDCTNDDAFDYYMELRFSGIIETLAIRMAKEIFFVTFGNRELMRLFNVMMARPIQKATMDEIPEDAKGYFRKDGVLKRVHIPKWARKAVFFRDRGCCVCCGSDISGLVNIGNTKNFDHIIPLNSGGLNDVTNLQLLCEKCNNLKGDTTSGTSNVYETWY